jgi:hypothetical protein
MTKIYADLPEWSFLVEEVSAGAYQVVASDKRGRRVEMKGTDFDALLNDARAGVASLLRRADGKSS